MDFADKLTKVMAEADGGGGVGQNELRRRSGVPQTTISAYLKRTNRPSWAHVQAIAKALNVSCEALSDDAPIEAPAKSGRKPKGEPAPAPAAEVPAEAEAKPAKRARKPKGE